MNLLLLGVYVPVLFLIAIVITGQHHADRGRHHAGCLCCARVVGCSGRWSSSAARRLLELLFIGW